MIKRVVEVAGRAPFRERGKRASARQTRGSRFAAERRNPNSANHGQAIRTDQGFSRQKAAKNRRAAATDNAVLAYSVAATLRQPRSYQSVVTGAIVINLRLSAIHNQSILPTATPDIVINLRLSAIHNEWNKWADPKNIVINLRLSAIHNDLMAGFLTGKIVINLRLSAIHNHEQVEYLITRIITNPNLSAIYTQIDSDGCLF